MAKACKRDLPPAVLALLEEFPTPPPAVMALLAESPTPAPKIARRHPKIASAPPPPANAASVGRENEVHPAFRESAAPAAIPATDAPSATAPLTADPSFLGNCHETRPIPPTRSSDETASRNFGKRSASRRFGPAPPRNPRTSPRKPWTKPRPPNWPPTWRIFPRTPAGLLIPVLPVSAGQAPRLPPFRPAPRRLPCQNPPVGRRQPKPLTP